MMELGSPLAYFFTALAAFASAIGLQKWFPDLMKSLLNKKSHNESECEKHIAELTSAVTVILKVVKHQIEEPGLLNAIDEVEDRIKAMSVRYKINS